jgi:hypothetical protein
MDTALEARAADGGRPLPRWPLVMALVLLPIDWFGPTGLALREAGAKPASPFLAALLVWLLLRSAGRMELGLQARRFLHACALVVCVGCVAFGINLVAGWSPLDWNRSPVAQFAAQLAMFLLFVAILASLLCLLRKDDARVFVIRALPYVALFHFAMFQLEAFHVLDSSSKLLLLFRNENGTIERASGLMSEPSYWGTFAALFGVPMMLTGPGWRVWQRVLGGLLLVFAFVVRAKTMFIVLAAQMIYLFFAPYRSRWARPALVGLALLLGGSGTVLIQTTAATDLDENLSSVMRVGSTALSMNVAKAGYALTGIGFGQFHFFYTPEFAPDFLFLSKEAQAQFSHAGQQRASTYNLFTRMLVETGVVGAALFLGAIASVLWRARRATDDVTRVGMLFVYGALGFLMTQDTYCYPPLAFGLALVLSAASADDESPAPPDALATPLASP